MLGLAWVLAILALVVAIVALASPWWTRALTGGSDEFGPASEAIVESISDTGLTIPGMLDEAEATVCRLVLQVSPPGGGSPYRVEVSEAIARYVIPKIHPGARIGVFVDPKDPKRVLPDLGPFAAGGGAGGARVELQTHRLPSNLPGANLLATGTRGTATVRDVKLLLGMTVGQVNPMADPARLNDPVYLFTVEVTVPGEEPFRALFGNGVPQAKVAAIAAGARLVVAVNMANRSQEVTIDWDRSPVAG
jgi:hypothetical protein